MHNSLYDRYSDSVSIITAGNVTPLEILETDSAVPRLMPLLLIGDESEEMISGYISRSTVFEGKIGGKSVAVCAAVDLGDGIIEIKNLAVLPQHRKCGIGRRMLLHAEARFPGHSFILGTGETPSTLRFYRSCGYGYSHRIPGFFTDNYPHPIIEEGVLLKDMVYLIKRT